MDTNETCLKVWRDKILNYKRKDLSPGELSSLFQQPDLQHAFFKIIDRDLNGAISLEEWTGSFTKLLGDADSQVMNWFVDKFNIYCSTHDTEYLTEQDFSAIVTDIEVLFDFKVKLTELLDFLYLKKKFMRYDTQIDSGIQKAILQAINLEKIRFIFSSIISPKSRRVNALHLLSSLEIIASMSTDSKWLSWLKYQFTDAMIKSNRISNNELFVTLNDFIENFNFKEPFLAHRLFNYMDKDKSGTLSLYEFINGLEVVVNGSQEQKMEFLFKVFDVDNDGHLDYEEMRMMLKCCLENSPSLDLEETIDDLVAALFKDTDRDGSGDVTIEELKNAFKRHESLFSTLSVSTSIWIKPKFINKKPKHKWYHTVQEKIINNRAQFTFWSVYLFIHILCSVTAMLTYFDQNIYVICARMCGNGLNFNCALVIVLVLRKHFTWLRSKGAAKYIPIDDFIEIHKIIGVIILIETLIHTVMHFINLYIVCMSKNFNYWTALFTWEINLGFPTGIIEIILLFIILLFAMSFVRNRGYFQLFYWFHSLTIPFSLIMLTHGKVFWRWLLLPGFCYAIEKILRYRKVTSHKYGESVITEALVLPSKVVYLVIRRPPKFHFKPGDYIFVNIPAIAKYEWHPFSISSAPENSDYIWLHIRACGNWTKRLYNYSSTSRFDANTSYASQKSSASRIMMRARMSKVFIDDGTIDKSMSKKYQLEMFNQNLHDNKQLAIPPVKKAVSFEKNSAIVEVAEVPTNVAVAQSNPPIDPNNPMSAPLRHKGILKVLNQGSFNGNETIGSNMNEITESTPKILKKPDGTDQPVEENLNASNPKLSSLKSSSQFRSVDLNDQGKLNLANEYFASKDKQMNINKIETKDSQIVIQLNDESLKKNNNENFVISYNNQNIHENSLEDEYRYFVAKNNNNKLEKKEDKDDILGYLKMYQKANRVNIETIGNDQMWRLKVLIDGPYGTPSQDIFDSEHAVLIAAGIGITPFASILQSLMHKYRRAKATCPCCNYKLGDEILYNDEKLAVKKVDFIWITREQRSLEWFISMLSQMEIELRKNDDQFLETHLYVTSAKRQSDLRSIGLHLTLDALFSQEESSLIDGLRQRTHYGRPNWDIVMQNLIRKQKGKINVFYCGVPSLASVLQSKCNEYGLAFRKEVF